MFVFCVHILVYTLRASRKISCFTKCCHPRKIKTLLTYLTRIWGVFYPNLCYIWKCNMFERMLHTKICLVSKLRFGNQWVSIIVFYSSWTLIFVLSLWALFQLRIDSCCFFSFHWGMKGITDVRIVYARHTKMCATVIPFIPQWNEKNQLSILIIIFFCMNCLWN